MNFPKFLLWCVAWVVSGAYLATVPASMAQTVVTGELTGTVLDPSGAAVPGAHLSLKNEETGQTQNATSGANGQFRFSLVSPAAYTLTVSAVGFAELTRRATVNLGQATALEVQLALRAQTEIVTVTGDAALVQVENANVTSVYDARLLASLPAPGNDITTYAQTAPGVTVSTGGGFGNFSVLGLPAASNLFTVNGTDNMDPYYNVNNSGASNLTLGANELQEAAVVLNGYTGQYGRQAGAQVNYVTKSGTNDFHGDAAWWWNGSALNANNWFNNSSQPYTPRPHAVSNEWAWSVGGPIRKNQAFFFVDQEGLRYVLPSGGPVYEPTPAFATYVLDNLKANNPSALPLYQNAFDVWAHASGANRARPLTAREDPRLGCGDITPTAGFPTAFPCAQVFQNSVNNLNKEWLLAARTDLNVAASGRLYLRYNMDRGVQATGTDPINPAFNANSVQPQYGGQLGYTRAIGAAAVNELLLSASYYSAVGGPPDYANAIRTFPTSWVFNDGVFSNLGGLDYTYPQGRKVRQWQALDDFSRTWSRHTLKAGANIRRNWVSTYASQPNQSGYVLFNSMADFLNGSLANGSTFTQAFPLVGAEDVSMYSAGFYLQDQWRARRNLTFTLALRFSHNSNIECAAHCFSELGAPFGAISHTASTPYNAAIHAGLSNAFPSTEAIVPEPRIGVAYQLTKSTVLRGGFGIFSDLYQGLAADRFITNSPNVASFTAGSGLVSLAGPNSMLAAVAGSNAAFQSGFANGATLAQLQAAVPLGFAPPNFNTVSEQFNNPRYYEWNFEVQQAIRENLVLSVNYVGNHGYNEINQSLFGNQYSTKGFAGLPTARPDPRFGETRELLTNGWSNYDGVITSLKWRMRSQFQGSFSYTWSHALDTCSNACLVPFNLLASPSIRNQISPSGLSALNYSNADYDTRHSFNANYVYTVPASRFRNRLLKEAVGGWMLAGTFLFHSGYPFSVVNSGVRSAQSVSDASGLATQTFLADYLGTGYPSCTTPNSACLLKSQFATSANQHDFGNIPRNSFRGPGYFDTDVNVSKILTFHDRLRLQIGAYLFNALNHPNFDNPFNNVGAGNFGQILQTVAPPSSPYGSFQGSAVSGRIVQTQVKFTF